MKRIICRCGCHNLKRKDLKWTKVQDKVAWRCPNHHRMKKGAVHCVIIKCYDCDIPFVTTMKGAVRKERCTPCQKIRAKELIKKHNKKNSQTGTTPNVRGNSVWYKKEVA